MPSIRKLIEDVNRGEIRIPDFQRGFVWDPDRIAYLMDSIYKNYPFGTLILWKTREQLARERKLGPFSLPEPKADYPIQYVLDGQQRITSIFGVFQTELSPDPKEKWPGIYFDFDASEDLQDTQFVALDDGKVIPGRHFPISTFFDSTAYRQATSKLTNDRAAVIDKVQSIFKEAVIPTQEIETNDRAKVAIVFERVNRLGVELDTLQLLSAWTWSDDFHLRHKFDDLAEELEPFGFGNVGDDSNLLLRCCAAVATSDPSKSTRKEPDASPTALMDLSGAEVRARFDSISNGVRGAIDFLRANLKVEKLSNLPYPTVLAPLSVFFAHENGRSVQMSELQRSTLVRWFWRSCFSRRFSAGVLRNLKRDIEEIVKLREGRPNELASISASVSADFFRDRGFSISAVDTKTFVLMLAQFSPRSFVSGSPVSLQQVLQSYNRSEFHHLMPQKFLKEQEYTSREINSLSNFAMISASDNKKLGGSAPSSYKEKMPTAATDVILESALCPNSLFDDNYPAFIQARAEKLAAAANTLIS